MRRWTTGEALRLVLEIQLEFDGKEGKEGAIHAAQLGELGVQVFPVGLVTFLLVQVAHEVELVLDAQGAGFLAEPGKQVGELAGQLPGVVHA